MGFSFKELTTSVALATALASVGAVPAVAGDCDPGAVTLRGPWGQARFTVEIADDAAERAQGLMNRQSMPRNAGMLFIYEKPQPVAFWMKNTLIPLDMLFIDEAGTVQAIHENAIPLDTTAIPGGDDIKFVLEINGGVSSMFGITTGSELQHPQIDQKLAVWPCDSN